MARIIETEHLVLHSEAGRYGAGLIQPDGTVRFLTTTGQSAVYNCFDVTTTYEIEKKLESLLDDDTRRIYRFERAQLGPAFAMMIRGFNIDQDEYIEFISALDSDMDKLEDLVQRYAAAVWDFSKFDVKKGKSLSLNFRSTGENGQFPHFLYNWPNRDNDTFPPGLMLPPVYKRGGKAAERKLSTDQAALQKCLAYRTAKPIIKAIQAWKDLDGIKRGLKGGLDSDGRMRASFNVAATDTGRWSSSKNAFGRGTNGQNITERARKVFCSDAGWVIFYADGEQAESRVVGYLSGDEKYIDACESGDLHTTVAKQLWPDKLPWTGDIAKDRALASNTPFHRHMSHRDTSKRAGHATNYNGSPWELSQRINVPQQLMEEFQEIYLDKTYTGIRDWHTWVIDTIQTKGILYNPLGRKRTFFGRPTEKHTINQAIAHIPQSTQHDILSIGILRVFRSFDTLGEGFVRVLADQHDALCGLIRDDSALAENLERVRRAMEISVPVKDIRGITRILTIPVEIKVGFNLGSLADLSSDKFRAERAAWEQKVKQWEASNSIEDILALEL